jgi:hypothetical protein
MTLGASGRWRVRQFARSEGRARLPWMRVQAAWAAVTLCVGPGQEA